MVLLGFNSTNIDRILEGINLIGGVLLKPTVSLCQHCYRHVPAWRYHKNNQVFIAKSCAIHGVIHAMIENDYEFYSNIFYTKESLLYNFDGAVIIEGSDRCNLDCPHCYHLPENNTTDISMDELIRQCKRMPLGKDHVNTILLAGAESTLRHDFIELVGELKSLHSELNINVMTNGIRFADYDFFEKSVKAGLYSINIGLNHPSYIDHHVVRKKQTQAITNSIELGIKITYISYTMIDYSELDYILNEVIDTPWFPYNFRIRCGAEIGRNASSEQPFVSNLYKQVEEWCRKNGKHFERIEQADNNIYHIMVKIENKIVRLISWCDITNIDMEELMSGPWCDFVPDGITNFLHQVIRRDIWKNKGLILPDSPPDRYKYSRDRNKTELDLLRIR